MRLEVLIKGVLIKKSVLRMILEMVVRDTKSVTGSNLRKIMLLQGKSDITELQVDDGDIIEYFSLEAEEEWKVDVLEGIMDGKEDGIAEEGMLEYLCTE